MSTQIQTTTGFPGATVLPYVPPLENGDCLSRDEFERRYEAMPDLKKAELIDGVVYVGSPFAGPHSECHAFILAWLGVYGSQTHTVAIGDNATVRLSVKNEVQPDALMRLKENGQSTVGPDNHFEGAPEFVAEVASSSVSREPHSKLELYQRHGVKEYLVWRVLEQDLDWFRLVDGVYQPLTPDENGVIRSVEFPGLWLNRIALLKSDMAAVLTTLNQGINSPEHGAFIGC